MPLIAVDRVPDRADHPKAAPAGLNARANQSADFRRLAEIRRTRAFSRLDIDGLLCCERFCAAQVTGIPCDGNGKLEAVQDAPEAETIATVNAAQG